MIDSKANSNFLQGLEARFIDTDMARLLNQCKVSMAHFALDLMKNEAAVLRGLAHFKAEFRGQPHNLKVYILTNFNTTHAEDWYRVRRVMELGYQPDVRIYQKGTHDRFLTDLSRWANNNRLFRTCGFGDYIPRKDGKSCRELYGEIIEK